MGFFNKLKNQLRKSIRTGEAPGMPSRGGFLEGMPQTKPGITDMRFRGRMPQKITGLSGLFRRFQEQLRNQQIPQPMPVPGGPLTTRMRIEDMLENRLKNLPVGEPVEAPVMPRISMPELTNFQSPVVPTPEPTPRAVGPLTTRMRIEDMLEDRLTNLPVPEERMAPPVMNQMQAEPRMMMAGGRDANMVDFLNSDPQQQIFGIETRIGILENQLEEAKANNDRQAYDMIVQQINDADAQRINIMNSMNPMNSRMMLGESGRTISNMDRDYLDDILSDLEKKN